MPHMPCPSHTLYCTHLTHLTYLIAATYNGTLCKDYINYSVWVPDGLDLATIENGLVQQGLAPPTLALIPSTCLDPLMQYACSASFPKVEPAETRKACSQLYCFHHETLLMP